MQISRKLYPKLIEQLETKEIIVLTGMRRVGKTTLFKMVFDQIESQNKVFLDLENPIDQKIFEEEDYNNIWINLSKFGLDKNKKAYLFLDEIQSAPKIVNAVKYLFDHYEVKFFLTGSSSYYLKNLFPESLAGRKFLFVLSPLDFEEFLLFKNVSSKKFYHTFTDQEKNKNYIEFEKIKGYYEEYLEYGGFPQVVLADLQLKKFNLDDIFKSYIEKDVRSLADFKEISLFRDLVLLLSQRTGSKLEITKLASELHTSRQTIYSYLSFLEGTFFITLLSPFTKSVDQEISKAKKVYFCDTGILNHIAKVGEGNIFENAVYNNLKKYGRLKYYQRRNGKEIDFILNDETAFEVKVKASAYYLKTLNKSSKLLNIPNYYLISKEFSKEKHFIPAIEI